MTKYEKLIAFVEGAPEEVKDAKLYQELMAKYPNGIPRVS